MGHRDRYDVGAPWAPAVYDELMGPLVDAVDAAVAYTPRTVVPPLTVFQNTAASSFAVANRCYFSRFSLDSPTSLRYARLQVDVQAGNIQVGVVALSGAALDTAVRTCHTGVIACPTAGIATLDMGATDLDAGNYAVFLWCDASTAQFRLGTNAYVQTVGLAKMLSGVTGGVGATPFSMGGWDGLNLLGGIVLEGVW